MSNSTPVGLRLARSLAVVASGWLMQGAAAAQGPTRPSGSDPLNAEAPVPAATHRSAIAAHRGATEQPVSSWREANETVTRIGGWRAYAKERAADAGPVRAGQAPGHEGHAGNADRKGHAGHKGHKDHKGHGKDQKR